MIQLIAISYFLFSSVLFGATVRFDFKDALRRNSVDIIMEGPLERTVAVSHFVTGWMEINTENVMQGLRGEIDVDVRTFETGVELKNLFLRDKVFDAASNPIAHATFVKTLSTSNGRLIDGQPLTLKVEAQFALRGVTKNLTLPIKLTYYKESDLTKLRLPGNLLLASSQFEVELNSFGITIPEGLKASSQKSALVNLNCVGSDRLPVGTDSIPEGLKPKK